jgi:hypothetical protein
MHGMTPLGPGSPVPAVRARLRAKARVPHPAAAVLLAAGAAQAADAVTFLRLMADLGPRAEGNPLVAAVAAQGHLGALVLAKVVLVGMVVLVVALCARRYPVTGALVATLGMVAGLVGAWSNVLVLLHPVR